MDRYTTLFLASLGVLFIFAGYQLFCGLPAANADGSNTNWRTVFFLNIVPGVLLALLGTGILMAQVRGVISSGQTVRRHAPTSQGSAGHRVYASLRSRTA